MGPTGVREQLRGIARASYCIQAPWAFVSQGGRMRYEVRRSGSEGARVAGEAYPLPSSDDPRRAVCVQCIHFQCLVLEEETGFPSYFPVVSKFGNFFHLLQEQGRFFFIELLNLHPNDNSNGGGLFSNSSKSSSRKSS